MRKIARMRISVHAHKPDDNHTASRGRRVLRKMAGKRRELPPVVALFFSRADGELWFSEKKGKGEKERNREGLLLHSPRKETVFRNGIIPSASRPAASIT